MKSSRSRRSSQVPGQYLGYSLQTTRALMRLLSASEGSYVTVEALDDVATVDVHGSTTLEQTKSVGRKTNPIADRSLELWKALANWIRSAKSGAVTVDQTQFEFYVSRRRKGPIAESFSRADSVEQALLALNAAKGTVCGGGQSPVKSAKVGVALAPHVDYVFSEIALAAEIVSRMTVVFGSGTSMADIGAALGTKLVSAEARPLVAAQMLGWTKAKIDALLEQNELAVISVDEFNAELLSYVRKIDRFTILNCSAPSPDPSALDFEMQTKTYVRQLDLIGSDYDTKLSAATDYLRASINRSTWARKGLVHQSSFDEFEEVLLRAWRAKRDIVGIQSSDRTAEARGRLLYSECTLLQANLEGHPVPPHFTPGCYHALSELLHIGWHPDYRSLLAKNTSVDDKGRP